MGRIIRRTVTMTITETWTIVWAGDVRADDKPQRQATTIVQAQPKTQEEPDELLHATGMTADPGKPTASDPTATSPLPAAALDAQPDGVTARPDAGNQGKHAGGRRGRRVSTQ